jgi:hypothetical protein
MYTDLMGPLKNSPTFGLLVGLVGLIWLVEVGRSMLPSRYTCWSLDLLRSVDIISKSCAVVVSPGMCCLGFSARTLLTTGHRSLDTASRPQQIPRDEQDIGRPLAQPPHEVGIPLAAEGNVDADAPAVTRELSLQVAADAVEHLEFE